MVRSLSYRSAPRDVPTKRMAETSASLISAGWRSIDAAVDDDTLAGHVGRVLAAEEADHAGDILGTADPAERLLRIELGDVLDAEFCFHQTLAHVGGDQPGRHDVHVDAVGDLLLGKSECQCLKCRLCHVVGGSARSHVRKLTT